MFYCRGLRNLSVENCNLAKEVKDGDVGRGGGEEDKRKTKAKRDSHQVNQNYFKSNTFLRRRDFKSLNLKKSFIGLGGETREGGEGS